MVIGVRNSKGELKIKDLLDINIDMSVERKESVYYVKVSKNYYLDDKYANEEEAEKAMYAIANIRNQLENELRDQ